jgi:transcription elongation factor Elf1
MQQSEQHFRCPYCGERISVLVDHSELQQDYIEDCEVCCRPIVLNVQISEHDHVRLVARRGDD